MSYDRDFRFLFFSHLAEVIDYLPSRTLKLGFKQKSALQRKATFRRLLPSEQFRFEADFLHQQSPVFTTEETSWPAGGVALN